MACYVPIKNAYKYEQKHNREQTNYKAWHISQGFYALTVCGVRAQVKLDNS